MPGRGKERIWKGNPGSCYRQKPGPAQRVSVPVHDCRIGTSFTTPACSIGRGQLLPGVTRQQKDKGQSCKQSENMSPHGRNPPLSVVRRADAWAGGQPCSGNIWNMFREGKGAFVEGNHSLRPPEAKTSKPGIRNRKPEKPDRKGSDMEMETLCLHGGYAPENGEPQALPICQSTTYRYGSTEEVSRLFDLQEAGFFYSRIGNPTVDAVERKIALLEGGVGALCTSSGQAASLVSVLNILSAGDHMISSSAIYGGTLNLFAVTLKKLGIEVSFVEPDATDEELLRAFRPNTRALFGETISNPSIRVLDIERFARLAHSRNVPLIVDNTFATPVLCRPMDFGADIVIHSTTKYLDGHALQVGGVIVDSGRFDWTCGNFPDFTGPDPSYHGLVYTEAFGSAAYITKARVQLMRDMGVCQSPFGAFLINQGLETLPLRMERHCRNAEEVARFLVGHRAVASVSYPTLPESPDGDLAARYLPKGCSGVISFSLAGGRSAGAAFIDALKMVSLVVHVADIRTCVLHPASSTHRQLSDSQLVQAGITPGMVRLSVGLENINDIIDDLRQSLDKL